MAIRSTITAQPIRPSTSLASTRRARSSNCWPDSNSTAPLSQPYKHEAQASERLTKNTLDRASCLYSRDSRKNSTVQPTMITKHYVTTIRLLVFTTLVIAVAPFTCGQEAREPPVRIYLLVGQSNMQGKGAVEGEDSNSLRYAVKNDTKRSSSFLSTRMAHGESVLMYGSITICIRSEN